MCAMRSMRASKELSNSLKSLPCASTPATLSKPAVTPFPMSAGAKSYRWVVTSSVSVGARSCCSSSFRSNSYGWSAYGLYGSCSDGSSSCPSNSYSSQSYCSLFISPFCASTTSCSEVAGAVLDHVCSSIAWFALHWPDEASAGVAVPSGCDACTTIGLKGGTRQVLHDCSNVGATEAVVAGAVCTKAWRAGKTVEFRTLSDDCVGSNTGRATGLGCSAAAGIAVAAIAAPANGGALPMPACWGVPTWTAAGTQDDANDGVRVCAGVDAAKATRGDTRKLAG
mmetsp:Transcript_86388/g.241640  ORF Transcript_86388/g.241640 Transcript_86388/m.241640 type:complete len:282 (+) Transcript_86388:962-1807(+)